MKIGLLCTRYYPGCKGAGAGLLKIFHHYPTETNLALLHTLILCCAPGMTVLFPFVTIFYIFLAFIMPELAILEVFK